MARPLQLYVFCYDIARDSVRGRVGALLEQNLTRVQRSVFEGRLTVSRSRHLAGTAASMIGPDDSLRVYCVTEMGRRSSSAFGPTPLAEADDFWLL